MTSEEIEQLKQKLYEKLKPSGWAAKLKGFILSSDFDKILIQLDREVLDGDRFVPSFKYVFNAFYECPWDQLKVVIIGQDPYPYLDVADGMCFSCSIKKKALPSLRYILDNVNTSVYKGELTSTDPDLKRWANQGVLLLNAALTTTLTKVGTHYDVWRPFMKYVLDIINSYNPGMIYIFMGKVAQEFAPGLNNNNYKILASHPASAAHNGTETWDSGDCWNHANRILKSTNNLEIKW